MATTTYKGVLAPGRVEATFEADESNADPDLLVLGFTTSGGGSIGHAQDHAAHGSTARAELDIDTEGMLKVMVAIGTESDGGTLTVMSNGQPVHSEAVQGSVNWIYAVTT